MLSYEGQFRLKRTTHSSSEFQKHKKKTKKIQNRKQKTKTKTKTKTKKNKCNRVLIPAPNKYFTMESFS